MPSFKEGSPETANAAGRLANAEVFGEKKNILHFALQCNGYRLQSDNKWMYEAAAIEPIKEKLEDQKVSFFGPTYSHIFTDGGNVGVDKFISAFDNSSVINLLNNYLDKDEDQARRLAYLLGGIVRYPAYDEPAIGTNSEKSTAGVEFVATMLKNSDPNAVDAVAGAMAVYVLSKGNLQESDYFKEDIYRMSVAVADDPIHSSQTEELGLSQIARLRSFNSQLNKEGISEFPDVSEGLGELQGSPTVGAEFHFPKDIPSQAPHFWQRLALLNMSQYQQGSFIQQSRPDGEVIEVRMNPSYYPVTIANWNHMRLLLPELNQAYFTLTLNRTEGPNFNWDRLEDKWVLNDLRAIGNLSYASVFEEIPETNESSEINFGDVYLGETIRLNKGKYEFSGLWGDDKGDSGQYAIYTGYGNNLPQLAYFTSMVLARPEIVTRELRAQLEKARTLEGALNIEPEDRRKVFTSLITNINKDKKLSKAHDAGVEILQKLNP